jgi:hypothetical protein
MNKSRLYSDQLADGVDWAWKTSDMYQSTKRWRRILVWDEQSRKSVVKMRR